MKKYWAGIELKYRILIVSTFAITLFLTIIFVLVRNQFHNSFQVNIADKIELKKNNIYQSINQESTSNLHKAVTFATQNDILTAYKLVHKYDFSQPESTEVQGVRESLRLSIADALSQYEKITNSKLKLHFHLPPGRSLLRSWREKQTKVNGVWVDVSDDLSSFRHSVLEINSQQKNAVKGIEIGRGGFAIRGIAPIRDQNGEHFGSIEVLSSFQTLFDSSVAKGEVWASYMFKDHLDVATKLQDQSKHRIINNSFVEVSSTNSKVTKQFITESFLDRNNLNKSILKDHYMISSFPILDYTDSPIGVGVMLLDVTSELARINLLEKVSFIIFGLFVVFSFLSIYFTFNSALRPLDQIIDVLGDISQLLGISSKTLEESSQQLKDNTASQSEALNETSSAIMEISSMSESNARSSHMSIDTASDSLKITQQGVRYSEQIKETIEAIFESNNDLLKGTEETNQKLSEIVDLFEEIKQKTGIIDSIVFQTKLLSFNASVEATRAGEQGKGFSVVAEEMVSLASTSGEAAKGISEILNRSSESVQNIISQSKSKMEALLSESKSRVESSLKHAQESSETLKKAASNSGQISSLIDEIAKATKEQVVGVQMVEKSVRSLESTTHVNSQIAGKSFDQSLEIRDHSEQLNTSISTLTELVKGKKTNESSARNKHFKSSVVSFNSVDDISNHQSKNSEGKQSA